MLVSGSGLLLNWEAHDRDVLNLGHLSRETSNFVNRVYDWNVAKTARGQE